YSYSSHTALSSSEPKEAAIERDDGDDETFWSAQCSLSSSTGDERDEQQSSPGAEGTVFVALADDVNEGTSTLLWAMKNLAKDGSRVVIAHVRSPTRSTHRMGVKAHHGSMRPEGVSNHRNLQRDKAGKNMDGYALTAKRATQDLEIDCDEVVIEMDDVAEGLAQLIAIHGITRLVMGAAADQHYSKYTPHLPSPVHFPQKGLLFFSCQFLFLEQAAPARGTNCIFSTCGPFTTRYFNIDTKFTNKITLPQQLYLFIWHASKIK
uniref:RING-type E3 ubiquitin transferase n=2 Tax=Aegilops tauschii subsp. strangulata TaxID=200361 RepID=A0A453P7T6_AEGTS